ncbi:MAG: hypothetical protein IRY95_10105, partial [Clostridia bacterium]|nr:hypothetical protein [Clostridia bacterium]
MLQQQQQWETISGDPVALAVARGEPTWLLAERRQAWERACASELPGNDVEAWRRTDLKALGFRLDGLRWPDTAPTVDLPEPARAHLPSGEGESVAVQGEDGVSLLRVGEELAGRGGLWMDLETAARRHPDLVRPHLGRIARADDKLAWLHAAGWRGGLFLYVPRGVELSVPIRCLVWGGTPGRPVLDRTLVVAEEGSAVTLVEVTASPQAPADGGD